MPQQHKVLDAHQFTELFAKPGGLSTSGPITVHEDVLLNGKRMGLSEGAPVTPSRSSSCSLRNVAFTGNITICNFDGVSWSLQNCNFIKVMRFEECRGIQWHLTECDGGKIHFHRCGFNDAGIKKLRAEFLNVSGFDLDGSLKVTESEIDEVRIWESSIRKLVRVPIVETDDPVLARMLELAKIPVIVPSCVVARSLLPDGEDRKKVELY